MTCERCDEHRDTGSNFCPACGTQLKGACRPAFARRSGRKYGFVFIAGLVATVQVVLILLFELVTVWANTGYILDGVAGKTYPLYYITPHIEELITLDDTGIAVLFVVETVIVTLCAVTMMIASARHLRKNYGDARCLRDTPAYEVSVLIGINMIVEMMYLVMVMASGTDLDTGEHTQSGFLIFQYVNASVYEEFICRVMMLGLPCLIVALLLGRKDSPWWKYLVGGAKFEKWMIVFVIFSAAMFAAAHLDNWGLWKFVPTFAFGLIAGYLFLKYGAYAAILLHFINDTLEAGAWAMDAPALLVLGIIAAGFCALPCIVRYAQDIIGAVRGSRKAP